MHADKNAITAQAQNDNQQQRKRHRPWCGFAEGQDTSDRGHHPAKTTGDFWKGLVPTPGDRGNRDANKDEKDQHPSRRLVQKHRGHCFLLYGTLLSCFVIFRPAMNLGSTVQLFHQHHRCKFMRKRQLRQRQTLKVCKILSSGPPLGRTDGEMHVLR